MTIDAENLRALLARGPTTPVHQTGKHIYSAGLTHLAEVHSESGGRLIVAAVNALPELLEASEERDKLMAELVNTDERIAKHESTVTRNLETLCKRRGAELAAALDEQNNLQACLLAREGACNVLRRRATKAERERDALATRLREAEAEIVNLNKREDGSCDAMRIALELDDNNKRRIAELETILKTVHGAHASTLTLALAGRVNELETALRKAEAELKETEDEAVRVIGSQALELGWLKGRITELETENARLKQRVSTYLTGLADSGQAEDWTGRDALRVAADDVARGFHESVSELATREKVGE